MMNWLNRHLIYQLLNAKLKNNEITWDDELGWFKNLDDEIEEEIEI